MTEESNPPEVIRESLRNFLEENQPSTVESDRTPRDKGAERATQEQIDSNQGTLAELKVTGAGGVNLNVASLEESIGEQAEKVQLEGSLPEPSLPQRREESGEVDLSGPQGEVVNVVS